MKTVLFFAGYTAIWFLAGVALKFLITFVP